jgi:CBS domain containing-hemolysin-like protein
VGGLNLRWLVGLGSILLGVHLVAVALLKALRTYSRSRLEELCTARRHTHRACDVAREGEATESAAEALAVVTGLGLATLLALLSSGALALPALVSFILVGAAAYVLAWAIASVHAERVIDRLWPLAGLVRVITRPVKLAQRLSEGALESLARAGGAPRPARVSVELPSDARSASIIEAELPRSVRALIDQAIELTQRGIAELMTPRSAIVTLPGSVSAGTAARTFRQSGLSRIPLFGESRDDIVGILYAKDLFPRMTESALGEEPSPRSLVRPAHFVPETKNAYELLEEFRAQRTQIAIVLDEYGSVAGLITLEDLLEAVVGAIDDEHDIPPASDPLVPLDETRFEVDATVELEQLNERLALRLPTDGDFLTVGGLAFHALGRVPEPGATFRFSEVEFTVLEVVDHAIRRVRLELQPRAAVSSGSP